MWLAVDVNLGCVPGKPPKPAHEYFVLYSVVYWLSPPTHWPHKIYEPTEQTTAIPRAQPQMSNKALLGTR